MFVKCYWLFFNFHSFLFLASSSTHEFQIVAIAAADDFADDVVGVGGNGGETHALGGRASHANLFVDDLQILRARFQFARGHFENLIARVDRGASRCGAGDKNAPAADRARIPWAGVGVDIDHSDVADGNAKLLGDNQGDAEARNGAHVDLADMHGHGAVFVDLYDGAAAGPGALDP